MEEQLLTQLVMLGGGALTTLSACVVVIFWLLIRQKDRVLAIALEDLAYEREQKALLIESMTAVHRKIERICLSAALAPKEVIDAIARILAE